MAFNGSRHAFRRGTPYYQWAYYTSPIRRNNNGGEMSQQFKNLQIQKQLQENRQRSIEASKQMVFEVYENTIGMLEEFEGRESKDKMIKRSQVHIPDQSGKGDNDVKAILQTQILILETQMKTCDPTIRKEVSENLKDKTLRWVASREKQGIAFGETDNFVGQVFEVISNKETQHPEIFYRSPASFENVTMNDMETVVSQQARIGILDTEFADHQKKARIPITRNDDINLGIERFRRNNPNLKDVLPQKTLKGHLDTLTDEDEKEIIGGKKTAKPRSQIHRSNKPNPIVHVKNRKETTS